MATMTDVTMILQAIGRGDERSLTAGAWANDSALAAQMVGTQWQVSVPKTGGARCFRLIR